MPLLGSEAALSAATSADAHGSAAYSGRNGVRTAGVRTGGMTCCIRTAPAIGGRLSRSPSRTASCSSSVRVGSNVLSLHACRGVAHRRYIPEGPGGLLCAECCAPTASVGRWSMRASSSTSYSSPSEKSAAANVLRSARLRCDGMSMHRTCGCAPGGHV